MTALTVATSESCPVLNRSDNRELYFHLDTIQPLHIDPDNSLSRSQIYHPPTPVWSTEEPATQEKEPVDSQDLMIQHQEVSLHHTSSSSSPSSSFSTTASPRPTTTVETSTSTTSSTTLRFEIFYDIIYQTEAVTSEQIILVETTETQADSQEEEISLRNLSLNLTDNREALDFRMRAMKYLSS